MLDRAFPFYRPERCLREGCKSTKIWGHGFVLLCIEGYDKPLPFRRWRCPTCGCVYTIRPCGYWSRHSAPVWTIAEVLRYRLTHGFWNNLGVVRTRRGEYALAVEAFQRALSIDAGLEAARTNLARASQLYAIDRAVS